MQFRLVMQTTHIVFSRALKRDLVLSVTYGHGWKDCPARIICCGFCREIADILLGFKTEDIALITQFSEFSRILTPIGTDIQHQINLVKVQHGTQLGAEG